MTETPKRSDKQCRVRPQSTENLNPGKTMGLSRNRRTDSETRHHASLEQIFTCLGSGFGSSPSLSDAT